MRHQALVRRPLAPDGGDANHHENHAEVLHDEKTDRDASVERIDLVLVRQQLDDDDGARERQGDCRVGGGERVHAHRDGNQEPDDRRDHDLADTGSQRHGAECPDGLKIELEADHEQQQRNADARKQLNLFVLRDQTDAGRADQDADRNEGDDQRLPQVCADSADDGGGQERQRDFGERISGWHGLRLTTPIEPTLS